MPVEKFSADDEPRQRARPTEPADEEVSNTRGTPTPLKRLKTPLSVSVALALLILAYFLLIGIRDRPGTGVPEDETTLVPLEPQTVNLAEPGMSLEVRIVFDTSSPAFSRLLRRRTAQLADIAIAVISAKEMSELDSEVERTRLKRELADAISQHLRSDDARITNVYFTRYYYRAE